MKFHGHLLAAIRTGDTAAFHDMLKRGWPLEPGWFAARCLRQLTALQMASRFGKLDLVQALLAAGADPNAGHSPGDEPLACAMLSGNLEVMKVLLDAGARPDGRDPLTNRATRPGQTPLMQAAQRGRVEAMRLLLEHGANPAPVLRCKGMFRFPDVSVELCERWIAAHPDRYPRQ